MNFVWFYAKQFSSWDKSGYFNELDYSIRSVRKNYQGDVRCYVIGDVPIPVLDVIHIEAPPVVMVDKVTGQPRQKDHNKKYDVVLNTPEINEEFVLMWDDIYILKPTTRTQIATTYGRCEVTNPYEYIKTRSGGRPYKQLWVATYEYILAYKKRQGLKMYDWEQHMPKFMEKGNLSKLMDDHYMRDIPKLVTGMYMAYYGGETTIMPEGFQADLYDHHPGLDFDKAFEAHHMNIGDNVIVPELVDRMIKRFGA